MPAADAISYHPPGWLKNPHLMTAYAAYCRRLPRNDYIRQRLTTSDGDFLDLDITLVGSSRLAIVGHGLEGSSQSLHIRGMVHALNATGWDTLVWHLRGCGGEPNRLPVLYHAGSVNDLEDVINWALADPKYAEIALVGFSLSGNITLKYLGQKGSRVSSKIKAAVCISVPCDLRGCAEALAKPSAWPYMRYFLKSLERKISVKRHLLPSEIKLRKFEGIKNFYDYDSAYTAPLHGFASAEDYWQKCSSRRNIGDITTPTLIINALDDPFLSASCFPFSEARQNKHVTLVTPQHGGHVAFVEFHPNRFYWSERNAVNFLQNKDQNSTFEALRLARISHRTGEIFGRAAKDGRANSERSELFGARRRLTPCVWQPQSSEEEIRHGWRISGHFEPRPKGAGEK